MGKTKITFTLLVIMCTFLYSCKYKEYKQGKEIKKKSKKLKKLEDNRFSIITDNTKINN